MSFRLFIYYCAVCGGCAASAGWVLGRLAAGDDPEWQAAIKGMFLGLAVALALGLVDALWNGHAAQVDRLIKRVGVAVAVGGVGGLVGGFLGQLLYGWTLLSLFLLLGWVITGSLIGAAPGAFDYLVSRLHKEDSRGPRRKIQRGVLGGALGGLLGAILYLLIQLAWDTVLSDKEAVFWTPSLTGFIVLGLCIGLMIGLAQVFLREAWLRVEAGFRPGRELLLSKGVVTLGRAESCDLGLFGDASVERLHARIVHRGDRFLLIDAASPGGTFLNGQRVAADTLLRSGDEIRLGRCILRFGERRKHAATSPALVPPAGN